MTCLKCNTKNSYKAKKCRKCKSNPRKAGRGNGSHHEVSPMARATRTKNKRRENAKRACRARQAQYY